MLSVPRVSVTAVSQLNGSMGLASAGPNRHMKIVIKTEFMLHDRLGKLTQGDVADVSDKQAADFVASGYAEYYETKVIRDRPYPGAGAPLSASPVARALPQTIAKKSESGKRKTRKSEA